MRVLSTAVWVALLIGCCLGGVSVASAETAVHLVLVRDVVIYDDVVSVEVSITPWSAGVFGVKLRRPGTDTPLLVQSGSVVETRGVQTLTFPAAKLQDVTGSLDATVSLFAYYRGEPATSTPIDSGATTLTILPRLSITASPTTVYYGDSTWLTVSQNGPALSGSGYLQKYWYNKKTERVPVEIGNSKLVEGIKATTKFTVALYPEVSTAQPASIASTTVFVKRWFSAPMVGGKVTTESVPAGTAYHFKWNSKEHKVTGQLKGPKGNIQLRLEKLKTKPVSADPTEDVRNSAVTVKPFSVPFPKQGGNWHYHIWAQSRTAKGWWRLRIEYKTGKGQNSAWTYMHIE